jgi:diacylglycerol kinase family enzyme
MLLLAVGIGQRVGGGFYLTPDAQPDDGLLDSCLVEPVIRPTLLALVVRSMNGKHVTSPHVQMLRSRQVTLQSDMPLPIHTDGEIFARPEDDVRELTITIQSPGISLLSMPQSPL